ncbi:MAG: YraN family protein [Lachnospiraceae bacterium]|nr:YraN family protein [Lachnospiraceae bacterium]
MNTREVGNNGEEMACQYLAQNGVKIKERNFWCKLGEIDVIGYDEGYLVFFEIKYRKNSSKGSAVEAVDYRKQKKICKVADYYRMIHRLGDNTAIRFDVVAIDSGEIKWYKNSFDYLAN